MSCCCEDEQNRLQRGSQDEEMAIAANALIALGTATRDEAVCSIIPHQNQPRCEAGDDACGVLVFSSRCSTSTSQKETNLGFGQEVFVPTKWITAEHLKGRVEGFSASGNHMLVNLSQVLRVPPKAHLLIESEEENFDQEQKWLENSHHQKRKPRRSLQTRRKPCQLDELNSFQTNQCIEEGDMEKLLVSPVARSRISREDVHQEDDLWIDDVHCCLPVERRSNFPAGPALGRTKRRRRNTKPRFYTRQLKCLEGVEKIAEEFKVNYREVVKTVRDAVCWLKRAWMVVKHGKVASYFALERLVQAVQGVVKVKNSYSCKRQECLRMIVWCFVLGPDRLRRNWNLFDPDKVLHEGLLYSSKKVGGLLGIAGEFRKWERKEGYIDCRQDRERGAMVYEDEFVINHFEARYGPVDACIQTG